MMGHRSKVFKLFAATNLDALVPANSFYRMLEEQLDLRCVRDWVQDAYGEHGRPSVDPVVFFKLQLILFFERLDSERQLMRVVADRASLRWYLGYDWDEPLPDHSSLTRIRQRLGQATFQRLFEHVLDLCRQAGLVRGEELIVDSTDVRANADVDSLLPRWYAEAKAHVAQLFGDDDHDDGGGDGQNTTTGGPMPTDLPFAGTKAAEAALAAANQRVWRLLEQGRLDPERPAMGTRGRVTDRYVSTTDPDATPINKGGGRALGYHDHYVVDGGKARIILSALVTPGDVMDPQTLLDLVDRTCFRSRVQPWRVIADAGYGTGENLRGLAERGIRAYMPVREIPRRSQFFGPERFRYDAEHDWYICPQGTQLRRSGLDRRKRTVRYQAPAATCAECSLRERCTTNKAGRRLERHVDEVYREQARSLQGTAAYRQAMRKRGVWVEPLFGEAKQWHGLRRFRLRGLRNVTCEGLLVALGQNLKRWLRVGGWGRRVGPPGLRTAPFAPFPYLRPDTKPS
jgi:transposase